MEICTCTWWYKQKGCRESTSSVLCTRETLPMETNAKARVSGRNKGIKEALSLAGAASWAGGPENMAGKNSCPDFS